MDHALDRFVEAFDRLADRIDDIAVPEETEAAVDADPVSGDQVQQVVEGPGAGDEIPVRRRIHRPLLRFRDLPVRADDQQLRAFQRVCPGDFRKSRIPADHDTELAEIRLEHGIFAAGFAPFLFRIEGVHLAVRSLQRPVLADHRRRVV